PLEGADVDPAHRQQHDQKRAEDHHQIAEADIEGVDGVVLDLHAQLVEAHGASSTFLFSFAASSERSSRRISTLTRFITSLCVSTYSAFWCSSRPASGVNTREPSRQPKAVVISASDIAAPIVSGSCSDCSTSIRPMTVPSKPSAGAIFAPLLSRETALLRVRNCAATRLPTKSSISS